MSNPFVPAPGKIVIFGEWTGSEYVEYQAYIRTVVSTPAGEDEPRINLTYSDGVGAADQANNVDNIEIISGNVDYWRAQDEPVLADSLPPTITRPNAGDIVWMIVYDSVSNDDFPAVAAIRSIPGAPTDPEPSLNVSYYDPITDDDAVSNQVEAEPNKVTGEDHWFDFQGASA